MVKHLSAIIAGLYLFIATSAAQDRRHVPAVADSNVILPPSWAFGVLYGGYTNQQQTIDRVNEIRRRGYPIDAYWIDSWFWSMADKGAGPKKYIDFVADTVAFPDRKKMWNSLQQHKVKGGFWVWNSIQETGNETAYQEFLSKGFFEKTYFNKDSWHNSSTSMAMNQVNTATRGTNCGDIDFANPAAAALFKERMWHFFEEGADFLKLDKSATISFCKTSFELSQEAGKETKGRGFVLSHSFGTENPEYKRYPAKWTDDTRSDWNCHTPLYKFQPWTPAVALKENIAMFTDPAKSTAAIPFLCNDMGGFTTGYNPVPDNELFIRWMQFSVFNPLTEVFSAPENPTANLAWLYSDRADSLFRFYTRLRLQLFPYIYSYAYETRLAAKQMMRSLPGQLYQYQFGDELLVAPVYEKGALTRTLFLPEGAWVDYWTGKSYQGGENITVAAPLNQIPLFVKKGSIIPMRDYASSVESGSDSLLTLHVYPGADGSFTLREDDGISNAYLNGDFASTRITWNERKKRLTVYPLQGRYTGMHKKRHWQICVHHAEFSKAIVNHKKYSITRSATGELILLLNNIPTSGKLTVSFR